MLESWTSAVKHPRKRNRFADVLQAAHPGDKALHAHSKPGVRHRPELAQVQIPFEGLAGKLVLFQAFQQQIQVMDALAAADDFAVSFRHDEVDS